MYSEQSTGQLFVGQPDQDRQDFSLADLILEVAFLLSYLNCLSSSNIRRKNKLNLFPVVLPFLHRFKIDIYIMTPRLPWCTLGMSTLYNIC